MFTSKMPLLWGLNHILLALQICTIRYLEKNQRPKTQILSSGFVILRKKGSMCLGSARFVSTQAIFISRQVPLRAASVEMQTRELCLKKILPRQKLPSHYRPQMYVCQEELKLAFPVSNTLSRNWTTGYTSPFCTLWGSCILGLSLRRTQNFEKSLTLFHTSQAWACWPLKGIGKDQSGPLLGCGAGAGIPQTALGHDHLSLPSRTSFPTGSHSPSFSFWRLHSRNTELCQRLQICLLQTQFLLWKAKTIFSSFSHLFSTLSGLLSKEKLLPPKPQSFTSAGALSPNLHTYTLWLI